MSYMGEMDRITQREISDYSDKLAWKRSGFKDRQALEQAVRDLPLEKKVEMLTEINMKDMATMLFDEKQEFLLGLGHKTWVDGEESYLYAKETFSSGEWKVNPYDFHPVCVMGGSHTHQMNDIVMKKMKEKREANE